MFICHSCQNDVLFSAVGFTGKSLSEALIFPSTNPQYEDRLFIELQVQYMEIPSSNLGRTCCKQKLFLTFRTIFVHNMFSPCSAKRRASDKDVPVPYLFYYFLLSDFFATNFLTKQWPDRVQKRLRGAEKSTICTTILLFMHP